MAVAKGTAEDKCGEIGTGVMKAIMVSAENSVSHARRGGVCVCVYGKMGGSVK